MIDRLTTITKSRRNTSLREIDRRRVVLGETLRRSVQEIEDGEFEVIETTLAKGEKCSLTSDRKIRANRENARASTGPKTAGTFLLAQCYGCATHTLIEDVDGLYDADPKTHSAANLIKEITVGELKERNLPTLPFDRVLIDLLASARHRQVKHFQLINGLKPHLLEPALRGEHVGTIVRKDASS